MLLIIYYSISFIVFINLWASDICSKVNREIDAYLIFDKAYIFKKSLIYLVISLIPILNIILLVHYVIENLDRWVLIIDFFKNYKQYKTNNRYKKYQYARKTIR